MLTFLARRAALAVLTIVAVSIFSYAVIQMPAGDYVDRYTDSIFGPWKMLSPPTPETVAEFKAQMRSDLGLDRPLYVQWWKWMKKVVVGDFGHSLEHSAPIWEVISDRLLLTVVLAGATVIFTWVMAIPIGIYSAVRQYSIEDYTFTFIGFLGLATPDFLLALILLYVSFAYFDVSVGGLFSPEYTSAPWSVGRVWDLLLHLWIPAVVLGTSGTAGLMRIMRANLLDELSKPYVVTARAKGLAEWKVILKYPVRVALNPLVSTVGYLLPYLISGSVIVSMVLSLPTLGPILVQALLTQDMMLAATITLLLGIMTVIGTLLSDILLAVVDPRIRIS
jgi:peptide/nickel transport system permease protein